MKKICIPHPCGGKDFLVSLATVLVLVTAAARPAWSTGAGAAPGLPELHHGSDEDSGDESEEYSEAEDDGPGETLDSARSFVLDALEVEEPVGEEVEDAYGDSTRQFLAVVAEAAQAAGHADFAAARMAGFLASQVEAVAEAREQCVAEAEAIVAATLAESSARWLGDGVNPVRVATFGNLVHVVVPQVVLGQLYDLMAGDFPAAPEPMEEGA